MNNISKLSDQSNIDEILKNLENSPEIFFNRICNYAYSYPTGPSMSNIIEICKRRNRVIKINQIEN
jgi:hypothetical protein